MDYRETARNLEKMNRQNAAKADQSILALRSEIDNLRDRFLQADPEMEILILFGSLAGQPVRENPDIDLAVKSVNFFTLYDITQNSPFKVDLVDLDSVHPLIKAEILKTGQVLYNRI